MIKTFLSYQPIWQQSGITIIRIIVGLLMAYHGFEVFDSKVMKEYATWDSFKGLSSPALWVYVGKGSELVAGVLLMLGLFTRLAAVVLIITMLYISFFVGHGKIWYEDQHPFLFVLLGLVFIFCGPGKFSLDYVLFEGKDPKTISRSS
jgi:putative oxidoreductase